MVSYTCPHFFVDYIARLDDAYLPTTSQFKHYCLLTSFSTWLDEVYVLKVLYSLEYINNYSIKASGHTVSKTKTVQEIFDQSIKQNIYCRYIFSNKVFTIKNGVG